MSRAKDTTKMTTKKALTSLRTLLCCNGNLSDGEESRSPARFVTSPGKTCNNYTVAPVDEEQAQFNISDFVNKFLLQQPPATPVTSTPCVHGNSAHACVPCVFATHNDLGEYVTSRAEQVRQVSQSNTPRSEVPHKLRFSFCEFCDRNVSDVLESLADDVDDRYSCADVSDDDDVMCADSAVMLVNMLRHGGSGSDNDGDDASICSSCYYSNCTMCRQTHDLGKHLLANNSQLTSLMAQGRNASPDVIRHLLRQLDGGDCGVTSSRGRISSGSDASRGEKDSGVGRTDESLRHEEEDHSCCEQVRLVANQI